MNPLAWPLQRSLNAFVVLALILGLLAAIAPRLQAATDATAILVQGPVVAGNAANGNPIACGGQDASNNIQFLQLDASKNLKTAISGSLGAGSNLIGKVGIDQTTNGTTNNVTVFGLTAAGQAAMASSIPVVVANNQSAFAVNATLQTGANAIGSITNVPLAATLADALTNPSTSNVEALQGQYNGTTWDRVYNNYEATGIASTVYNSATTTNGSAITNFTARGIIVVFDVTAFTAAGTSTTINVQGKGTGSAAFATIYSFVPTVSATGPIFIEIYPGASSPDTWTFTRSGSLPRNFRISVTTVGTVNYTATCYVDSIN